MTNKRKVKANGERKSKSLFLMHDEKNKRKERELRGLVPGGGPQQVTSGILGVGSGPPGGKIQVLGGGAQPPRARIEVLGGGAQPPRGCIEVLGGGF